MAGRTNLVRWVIAVPALALALPVLAPTGVAVAQTAPTSEHGLKSRKGKPGLYVERIDASHYRVSAYLKSMRGDSERKLKELANMVMMRAAQFALENGREYFSIVGDLDTDTIGGKTVVHRGTPNRPGPTECYGRDANGNMACYPGKTIKGTPPSRSYDPGYFGRVGIIQFWTGAEGQRMLRGRDGEYAKGDPIPAAGYYKMYRDQTPGDWPELSEIYGERSKRMRGG